MPRGKSGNFPDLDLVQQATNTARPPQTAEAPQLAEAPPSAGNASQRRHSAPASTDATTAAVDAYEKMIETGPSPLSVPNATPRVLSQGVLRGSTRLDNLEKISEQLQKMVIMGWLDTLNLAGMVGELAQSDVSGGLAVVHDQLWENLKKSEGKELQERWTNIYNLKLAHLAENAEDWAEVMAAAQGAGDGSSGGGKSKKKRKSKKRKSKKRKSKKRKSTKRKR
jgi:hypothetical protein